VSQGRNNNPRTDRPNDLNFVLIMNFGSWFRQALPCFIRQAGSIFSLVPNQADRQSVPPLTVISEIRNRYPNYPQKWMLLLLGET